MSNGARSPAARGSDPAARSGARQWWLRTLLVVSAPRPVFVALRDDSAGGAADRAEPVLAIVLLAGIALVLSTSTAAHLLDDNDYDGLLVAVWSFLAGSLYGAVAYWLFGAVLHGAVRALGSHGSFRRSRHVLAFAAVPLALSLVLLPAKLALFSADVFHRGGADSGAAGRVFEVLQLGFVVWAAVLLLIGVRAVHGWSVGRASGALAIAVAAAAALTLAASFL